MALIRCSECGRDISDRAGACPGCGAPVIPGDATFTAPSEPSYADGQFKATRAMMAEMVTAGVHAAGYRLDNLDEVSGTAGFTTGTTMGSWAGVSGTIVFREVGPYLFAVSGAAKQNVRGGQLIALDLFGEAQAKVDKVIEQMRLRLVPLAGNNQAEAAAEADAFFMYILLGILGVVLLLVILLAART